MATDEEALQKIFHKGDYDFLYSCGYTKATAQVKMEDREELIKIVWLHFVKFHPYYELEQLRDGLHQSLNMDELIVSDPYKIWGTLVSSTKFEVTPNFICDSYVVTYSDQGSNNRTKEEAIILHWFEYVKDCKGKFIHVGIKHV